MTRHERLWGLPLTIPFSKSPEKPDGNEKGTGEGGYLSSFFFQRLRGPPSKRGAAAGLQTLQANNEEVDPEEEDEEEEELPPLHVFLTSKPCNPKNSTWLIWWSPKPKMVLDPLASQKTSVFKFLSNGWIT